MCVGGWGTKEYEMLNINQWGSNFVHGLYFSLVAEMNIFTDFPARARLLIYLIFMHICNAQT